MKVLASSNQSIEPLVHLDWRHLGWQGNATIPGLGHLHWLEPNRDIPDQSRVSSVHLVEFTSKPASRTWLLHQCSEHTQLSRTSVPIVAGPRRPELCGGESSQSRKNPAAAALVNHSCGLATMNVLKHSQRNLDMMSLF